MHTRSMATEKKDAKDKKPAAAKPAADAKSAAEGKPAAAKTKAPKPKKEEKGLLETTAEAIGTAIGTIAASTGIAKPSTPSAKIPKLAKKNKHRLPRKEKKRIAKLAASKGKAKK